MYDNLWSDVIIKVAALIVYIFITQMIAKMWSNDILKSDNRKSGRKKDTDDSEFE